MGDVHGLVPGDGNVRSLVNQRRTKTHKHLEYGVIDRSGFDLLIGANRIDHSIILSGLR